MAQLYQAVQRSLTGGQTQIAPDGTLVSQNFSEFMSYLNENYLSHGYEIHTITLLRYVPPTDQVPSSMEYTYHLVKEVTSKDK